MRVHLLPVCLVLLALPALAAACYSRPSVPLDKPLLCAAADGGECQIGSHCRGDRCVPTACATDDDCPPEFVCRGVAGCDLPSGGGDGGLGGDGAAPRAGRGTP